MAEKLGIPIRRRPGRMVALADGGKCPVDGICKGLVMTVQDISLKQIASQFH